MLDDWSAGGDRKGQEMRQPENRFWQGWRVGTKELRLYSALLVMGRGVHSRCGTYIPNVRVLFIRALTP